MYRIVMEFQSDKEYEVFMRLLAHYNLVKFIKSSEKLDKSDNDDEGNLNPENRIPSAFFRTKQFI